MQRSSYSEDIDPRLHIYPSREADKLKQELLKIHNPEAISAIGRLLLNAMDTTGIVPILVLRGALLLWQPCQEVIGIGPVGIVIPVRDQHDEFPRIAYASIPRVPGAQYFLLDVLVASGRTMDVCLRALYQRFSDIKVDVVAPFVSAPGRNYLLSKFPNSNIHCIWHAEQIDTHGRMVGPGFDIGDYALGWVGNYAIRAKESTKNA